MYELEFQDVNGTSTIQYNICEETVRRCPDLMPDHANIINSVGTCNHLSKVELDGEDKPGTLSLISEANPGLGVLMTYEGGNMCNETSHFSLVVQINCNPNLDKTTFGLDKESLNSPCDPKVIMNSPHACPVLSSGPLARFLEDGGYFIGAPMLLIGGYLCFFGGKHPGVTLFIFSTLAVGLIELFMLYLFVLPNFVPVWTVPIVGSVCLGMGLGMGYGAAKWPKIGVMIMGFCLGSLLGYLVYWSFLIGSVNTTTAKLVTILGVALFTAILYIAIYDHMVIVTSAIFGAYILVRGLSMYFGGYVNEFTVVLATQNGDLGEIRWTMFLYWAFMILLAAISIHAQLKDRAEHLEAYSYKKNLHANYQSYRHMSERIHRMGAGQRDDDSDYGWQRLDQDYDD